MRTMIAVMLSVWVGSLSAGAAAPAPAGPGALAPDSSLDQVLDALNGAGKSLNDFTAKVTLSESDDMTGESREQRGTVAYQKKGEDDGRIRVVFDQVKEGNKVFARKTDYLLDNGWLIEQDHRGKNEIRRQVLKPGETMNPVRLGQGPFPLPIGQDPKDVKEMFEAKKVASAKEDPAGTVHVELVPKKGNKRFERFTKIDVFVDARDPFPVRIETTDKNTGSVKTTDIREIKRNAGLKDADFTQPQPGGDWNRRSEALDQSK